MNLSLCPRRHHPWQRKGKNCVLKVTHTSHRTNPAQKKYIFPLRTTTLTNNLFVALFVDQGKFAIGVSEIKKNSTVSSLAQWLFGK